MLGRLRSVLKTLMRRCKAVVKIRIAAGRSIQPAAGNQVFKVDELFVSRMHGQTLVRRTITVRRSQGEHLPDRKSRCLQEIDEAPGIRAKTAVGSAVGQRCRVQQHTGAPVVEGAGRRLGVV